jgi:5-methyltetrahydrofolate--homocysteine methyltransferase
MQAQLDPLEAIRQAVIEGDGSLANVAVRDALAAGIAPLSVLRQGLMQGANEVGERFQRGECFLPELMQTGIALKVAMESLTSALPHGETALQRGTVVMATIKTDIHDIGKNLVCLMLSAAGFTVHDLGVDVPIDRILDAAVEKGADLVGCSALLTTSTPYLRELIERAVDRGLRDRFKIIVGGAAVTQRIADEIGADGTAPDAIAAVSLAKRLVATSNETE